MYCGRCGNKMNDADKFCANCGAPAMGSAPVVQGAGEAETRFVSPQGAAQWGAHEVPPASPDGAQVHASDSWRPASADRSGTAPVGDQGMPGEGNGAEFAGGQGVPGANGLGASPAGGKGARYADSPVIPAAGGASIPPVRPATPHAETAPAKRKKRNPFVILAPIAAAVVVVAVAVFVAFGPNAVPSPDAGLPASVVSRIVPADEDGKPLKDYTVTAKDKETKQPVGKPLKVTDSHGFAPRDMGLDDNRAYDFDIMDNTTKKTYETTWPIDKPAENPDGGGEAASDDGDGRVLLPLDELKDQDGNASDQNGSDASKSSGDKATANSSSSSDAAKGKASKGSAATDKSDDATVDAGADEKSSNSGAVGSNGAAKSETGDNAEDSDGKNNATTPAGPSNGSDSADDAEEAPAKMSTQAAFAKVVNGLEAQYSDAGLKNVEADVSGLQYAAGVPIVTQSDFDGDGTDELLVAYWDGATTTERNGSTVAQQTVAVYALDENANAATAVTTSGVSYGDNGMPVVLVAQSSTGGERYLVERQAGAASGASQFTYKRYDPSTRTFAALTSDEVSAKGLGGQGGSYALTAYELGKLPGKTLGGQSESDGPSSEASSLGFTASVQNYDTVRQKTNENVKTLTGVEAPAVTDDAPSSSDDAGADEQGPEANGVADSGNATSSEGSEGDLGDDGSSAAASDGDEVGEAQSYAGPSESDLEDTATAFGEAWYGGWDFDGDEMVVSDELTGERVAGYIDPESPLYEDALDSSSPDSVFFANAGLHAQNVEAEALGDGKCRIDVDYVGVQQEIDRETYERDVAERPQHASWILTFNDEGLVTGVEAA